VPPLPFEYDIVAGFQLRASPIVLLATSYPNKNSTLPSVSTKDEVEQDGCFLFHTSRYVVVDVP
jgi:hypothetical protein